MQIFDKTFKEIISAQTIPLIGGLLAGTILAFFTDQLILIPGLLIILPGFLELRGSVSGSIASRLSSGLFLKAINPRHVPKSIIRGNVLASFFLVTLVSFFLGLIALLATFLLTKIFVWKLLFLPVLAAIIADIIETPITMFLTLYFFRKGHDPNNIMGPFITSTGDLTSVLALVLVILLL